jgi:hypothetical protein
MIYFHGGCHGCTQQAKHGTDFCFNCCYFAPDWDKPSLNNRPLSEAELERQQVINRRTQKPSLGLKRSRLLSKVIRALLPAAT